MYYTDDSILPENMAPLIITAAPGVDRRVHEDDKQSVGSGSHAPEVH
jgi:hypothetical protein